VAKKRERALTPEEFKEKQLKDYTPFWIHSDVLFGTQLYPVDEAFTQQITILFLLDVADFTTERIFEEMKDWKLKYGKLPWMSVLVFQQKYAFLKNAKFFDRYKNQPILLDPYGELFERFGSQKEPVAVVLKNGQMVTSIPLLPNFSEKLYQLEHEFQRTLRAGDIGLPLPTPMTWAKKDVPADQEAILSDRVSTFGEWNGTKALLMTEQNGAILSLPFKGRFFRMIAMAHPNARESIRVSITLNEKPLPITTPGSLLHEDAKGASVFELNKITGIYDLVHSDHELSGIIKLHFSNAYENGVVFYEFRAAR